jgi:antitoxin HigA-1
MAPIAHPGRLLKRELAARKLSANRLALDIGVPSGRITDILNGRRAISADTAVRLGRYFGNSAQFWLDLQSQYDIRRGRAGEGRRNCPARAARGRCVSPGSMGFASAFALRAMADKPPHPSYYSLSQLSHMNVDVEIDLGHALLCGLVRPAGIPATVASAGIADICQPQASPLR